MFLPIVVLMWADLAYSAAGPSSRGTYIIARENPVISDWAAEVIQKSAKGDRVKVWVYFTDKGFADEAGLAASASARNVTLNARAAARRAKMGRDRVEFGDLPVREDYMGPL